MKTHYYPFGFPDDAEQAPCGTWIGEESSFSGDWEKVTCGHCKRSNKRIMGVVAAEEKAIVNQMGDMADFMLGKAYND